MAHPGSIDDYPLVVAVAEPRKIALKKGSAGEVTLSLTYKFKPVFDAPAKVIVQPARPRGHYLGLQAAMQLNDRDRNDRLRKMYDSGKQDPAFFDIGQIVSYPDSNPTELNAGETKSITMKLTIPENLPDEMLGKAFMVNSNFTINSKLVSGMSVGTDVTVIS